MSLSETSQDNLTPIPIPRKRQMEIASRSWLPMLFFVGASAICVFLWRSQNLVVTMPAEVEIIEVTINSLEDGVVSEIVPGHPATQRMFANVTNNQLVAVLDDRFLSQRLSDLNTKIGSLESEVRVASDTEDDSAESESSWSAAKAYVEQLSTEAKILDTEMQLRRLGSDLLEERQELSFEIQKLRVGMDSTSAGDFSFDGSANVESDPLQMRLFRERVRTVQTELSAISASVDRLDTRSPIEGRITELHARPGDAVIAGQPLLTVMPARGAHAIAYVRESAMITPFKGMPITLRTRTVPVQEFEAVVDAVGPAIEAIPSRQRNVAQMEEWGLPIRIRLPSTAELVPGALVEISLRSSME